MTDEEVARGFVTAREHSRSVIVETFLEGDDHRLLVVNGELVLSVRDDGRGFDLGAAAGRAARGESAGLSGMEERAQLAGGRLEMNTAPGRGTEVRALFPLAEEAR